MIAGALLTLIALSGCGVSHRSGSTTASSTDAAGSPIPPPGHRAGWLALAADPSGQLRYSKKRLVARTSAVKIAFTNMSPLPHNVTIATRSGSVIGATPTFRSGARALTLQLPPGRYRFYCSIPGHRSAGMQGTLVVK